MDSDFATKLHLTAAALGCASRKELSARFRAVNPATHFDLERSHKWLQGRALPRSAQVYDDWAKVLGTKRPGAWLAACTVAAFVEELCALFDADAETLIGRAEVHEVVVAPARPNATNSPLCGSYACYSLAWSPYYPNHLIRAALTIRPGKRLPALLARYTETLLAREVQFEGDVLIAGHTLHLDLRESQSISPLFMSLFLPGPPASALCDVMSGATVIGPEPQPSATRIVLVRVPGDPRASNRYLLPQAGAISADLLALGQRLSEPEYVDELIRGFLSANALDQISASDQARFASALDKSYFTVG